MELKHIRNLTILPSHVNAYGRLGVAKTFDFFMDTATEAAEAMGLGLGFLTRRGLIWLTVKTRVEFIDPPRLLDAVQIVTWPEAPGDMRCVRHYEIRRDGETLVRGKTEWAIASARTFRPQPLADIMPGDLQYPAEQACPEPFPMIDEAFPEPPFATREVRAGDIDMAFHMNNVAYVRAIVDAFSVSQWHDLKVKRMDVIFRASAHEGDTLQFQSRRDGDALDVRVSLPDGTTVILARLICE